MSLPTGKNVASSVILNVRNRVLGSLRVAVIDVDTHHQGGCSQTVSEGDRARLAIPTTEMHNCCGRCWRGTRTLERMPRPRNQRGLNLSASS